MSRTRRNKPLGNKEKSHKPIYEKCDELDEEPQRDFVHEIALIANILNISPGRIRVVGDHPCGEDVIFVDGNYHGYLDQDFYNFVVDGYDPYGDFEEWIARHNKSRKEKEE